MRSDGRVNRVLAARFYGVSETTIVGWKQAGAPLGDLPKMGEWLEGEKARKEETAKERHRQRWLETNEVLIAPAVELYCAHGMEPVDISRELGLKTSRRVVRLLQEAGVYDPNRRPTRPQILVDRNEEKARIALERAKEVRRFAAVCLRNLRRGVPLATTCRQHGWPPGTIRHCLEKGKGFAIWRKRNPYETLPRPLSPKRGRLSLLHPTERQFVAAVRKALDEAGLSYETEVLFPESNTRCDLLVGDTVIECKSSTGAGSLNEALGQVLIYQTAIRRPTIILLPDDLKVRPIWVSAAASIGVRILWERDLPDIIRGIRDANATAKTDGDRATCNTLRKVSGSWRKRQPRLGVATAGV